MPDAAPLLQLPRHEERTTFLQYIDGLRMIALRWFRRRSGSLCKGLLLISLVLFFVQVTSYPKGAYIPPAQENVPMQSAHVEEVKVPQNLPQNVPISSVGNPSAVQEQVASPKQVQPVLPKKSRENEFYKNIIVHFDLKGAPPRVPYFLEILRFVAKAGATGVMLEWEDMFPWSGVLEPVKSTDAYSMQDIETILTEVKRLNLDIIPLVQTFGHLEWILKLEEFRKFRDSDIYPQVLCLGDEAAYSIIQEALRQVVAVHKKFGIAFFNIGADEAFSFGNCEAAKSWVGKNEGGMHALALSHLKNVTLFVKQLISTEKDTTILCWHDMLKDFDSRQIKRLELGSVLQPVVWDYSENIITMNDYSFSTLAENFPTIWASSAFKGANYPSAKYIDIRHYEANNRQWITTKQQQERKFNKGFNGIIITGWQRYDHMAGLCEILPMGLPSMALQIQIALQGAKADQRAARDEAAKVLECQGFVVSANNLVSNSCNFPGSKVYSLFQGQARMVIENIDRELALSHHKMGWLNPYNRKHNMTQNWYMSQLKGFMLPLHGSIDRVEQELRVELSKLFFDNTVDEFLYETIAPTSDMLQNYLNEIERLSQLRTWPKRHFKIQRDPADL